jgi:hypothetical protein
MSDTRKFRFVSPGIFLSEVDQSQIPALPELVGPVIVGRSEKGPGMTPVKVGSFTEFVEKFGNPISGRGGTLDVWREGNYASPTYAAYAAQAYLRAGVGPITFLRLMGTQHPSAGSTGLAGWTTSETPNSTLASNGGPYGLFVFASASGGTNTGSLAAVWYVDSDSVPVLSGTTVDGTPAQGTSAIIKSDSAGLFKVRVLEGLTSNVVDNVTFSLNEASEKFIRKVFNTNPQLVNSTIEDSNNVKKYWLGETYERHLSELGLVDTEVYGTILALVSGSTLEGNHERDMPYRDAHTGWFFAQNLSADTSSYEYGDLTKLFKFVGINGHGEWLQNNVKVSLSNIKAPSNENVPYGTFDVIVRRANDSDLRPVILERYSACTLDPGSSDYIGVKIGDMYTTWDDTEKRYREYGNYENRSEYIRVVVNESVDNGGTTAELLPFGVYGPPRFPAWGTALSGTTSTYGAADGGAPTTTSYALGSSSAIPASPFAQVTVTYTDGVLFAGAGVLQPAYGTASIVYPAVGIRDKCADTTAGDGSNPTTNAYFGLQTGKSKTSTVFDPGYADYLRAFGKDIVSDASWSDTFGQGSLPAGLEHQWIFSLDEVVVTSGSNFNTSSPTNDISDAQWVSGSYKLGTSWNAANSLSNGAANYKNMLDSKINRFTSPLFGAFDGFDIKERDPFRNTRIDDSESETGNYTYYTLRRAIDTVADPEVVEMNILSIPGITNESITKYILDTSEGRADTLAVIDVKGGLEPRHESNSDISSRQGDLASVISNMKARNLNTSYGAAYYPWVKVRDDISGTFLDMPPSVIAMGVLANTERANDVWFAPAGFQRGGLSQGAGGLTVTGVETKLTSRNRDDLYDVNINPIASFPAEGIVVFGQKTLQATPSALDRINVRRLMIFVKRGISRIASQTLFSPNVQATWNDFKTRADRFLGNVRVRFGVDDFRVVLDSSTTTPDLVDRNIMYAKIFIKPTRAIEFIAIDFVISRSGASFED